MRKALTLARLDPAVVADVRQRYDMTSDALLRLRYQIVLPGHQGRSVAEIADLVFRSRDTVERVLHRFLDSGIDALARRTSPGKPLSVMATYRPWFTRDHRSRPRQIGGMFMRYTAERSA